MRVVKIVDKDTGFQADGIWVELDDWDDAADCTCPECGAEPGQCCSTMDQDGSPVEIGRFVHVERAVQLPPDHIESMYGEQPLSTTILGLVLWLITASLSALLAWVTISVLGQ